MADQLTVTLSHDDWQWIMSMVLNGAYLRAKPIVEAVEQAVKTRKEVAEGLAIREQGEHDDLRRQAQEKSWALGATEREVDALRTENKRLARQVEGYKGKMGQMRKQRANGHVDSEVPAEEISRQLMESRAQLAEMAKVLQEERRGREVAERHVANARAEWNAAIARPMRGDRPFPDAPAEPPVAAEIEATLTEGTDGSAV